MGQMSGDAKLGTVLRELRTARGLTLAAVARQAGCTESLVSYVESGQRQVYPWLAENLDQIYQTGSAVASLARGTDGKPPEGQASEVPHSDVFVVQLPHGGAAMPLSRREVVTALGVGIVSGRLQGEFERALDAIELDSDVLQYFDEECGVFIKAVEMLPPAQIIDAMVGNVAILDGLRRRIEGPDRQRCSKLQARFANWLSWMSQEAGDISSTLWWNDRASQWAQAAGWSCFTAWSFIRRTAMVHSFSCDGLRIVDQARPVLEIPHASARIKGLASGGGIAYGYALAGHREESYRALDAAISWLNQPVREDDIVLGQAAVPTDDFIALHQTTCDIYLGYGERCVPALEYFTKSLAGRSLRMVTATRAKLARAYANAGQPDEACQVAWDALNTTEQLGSQLARIELRRALPVLNRWYGRSDVQDVVHRLQT